ncbi:MULTISPECIES: multidrug effflux MFS transporter [unclassified Paenibacillus]|uniref:multidrug effflux MFS transporter n=1 Tax=unclassified Paenibacillus TaxID=185978 RepID=UPI0009A7014B|nr:MULTISPECIES: multidrug effflux MFS transporter [unclassified Paenibacillus]SLJ95959.1 MFS transporter, DHA1 family, bicyclomycin/chloramphenicol resistance protein [Paenibacillus sp. RU5A]SOC67208.1 MFS transporter, DHA1 family, bicyclomycin/chloramphenicol resistance protein [Paenibacillus sp. RU26A]SOC69526.1 MFS transporter, DHA1 family, bicyclomycin/chloramphenicol resistance protein [Paenibacillus sp. RU5M]
MKSTPASLSTNSISRVRMALILGTLSAFGPLSLDMYLPALPTLADEFQSSTSYAQLSLTACMVGLAAGQLLAGPLSDVRGRRAPLIAGLILYTIASILCLVSPTMGSFVVLRFIQGAAGAAGIVISRAVVRDVYSGPELTRFFSLLMLINGVAPIAAPIIGGQLLAYTSWRGVFILLSIIGVLTLVAVVVGLGETLPVERRSSGGLKQTLITFRKIAGDRLFMGYALTQGFVSAGMFAYISGSPFVLQKIYGISPQMFSICFAINGLGIILASQIAGRLAGKVSETRLLIAGLITAALGGTSLLIAILAGGNLISVLIPLFLVVSSVGLVNTASFSLAMANQEKSAGSASALIGVMTFLFGGIVAPLVGLGGEGTAVPMGIVIACADLGALLIYVVMVGKNGKRQGEKRLA